MGKWVNDVGNEHCKGEGLLCLVALQAAGIGRQLQVHPPRGAWSTRPQPSASQFTLLGLQPGTFFILLLVNT